MTATRPRGVRRLTSSPDVVESTITGTVGVNSLAELGDREALLVIDNFEHLLAAAPVVASLLAATTNAKVLATSRAPLRIDAEREYAVEPLPDDDAVELLTERARAIRSDFAPDDAAREICRRLDGLPLALELAAARLRSLGTVALLERLEHTLPVLTSGRRDAPDRQRTLRATIEWSYDLLPPELQQVFARLSIFATFTLEAAEAVAGARLDEVDALVEASLLKSLAGDRFLMLETIREFARERLDTAEADEMHRRHAEFYAELAASANLQEEAEGSMDHQLVANDFNNMRAALAWAVEAKAGELGLRLAISLENFWVTGTDPAEGRHWLEALLPFAPQPPSELHALALRCCGNCSVMLAEPEKGIKLYEQSLEEFRQLGDEVRTGISFHRIAANSAYLGDLERAASLNEESLALNRRIGFRRGEASSLSLAGDLERKAGNVERALELYEEAGRIFRETNFTWWEKNCLLQKAMALFDLGRAPEASKSARAALLVAERMGDRYGILDSLAFIARAALETGDLRLAGRLWGAVTADVERQRVPGWEREVERLWASLAAESEPRFQESVAEGRALTIEDAIALTQDARDA